MNKGQLQVGLPNSKVQPNQRLKYPRRCRLGFRYRCNPKQSPLVGFALLYPTYTTARSQSCLYRDVTLEVLAHCATVE